MQKILFIVAIAITTIIFVTGCNNVEDMVENPMPMSQDIELTRLYNSIDSLQVEYSKVESRVNWEKWGRRGFFYAVDGVVGLLFAETGPLSGMIAAAGSWLYEDYFDYMVNRCNSINRRIRNVSQGESSLKAVVFPVENATYIDSIGYYHNLIISEVQSNENNYISDNGYINFTAYYDDVLVAAKNHGIRFEYPVNTQLLFQYLESIVKPLAELELSAQTEIKSDLILSIFFNEAYNDFNYDTVTESLQRDICDKIIYNCSNVSDDQLIEYGTKLNEIIVSSSVDVKTKDNLKIANNIVINSSLRRIDE